MKKKKSKIRYCHNGHQVIKETDTRLKKDYSWYCPQCDENMYNFETYLGGENGKR
jgi:hypothetical protein